MHDVVDLDWSSVDKGRAQMRETAALTAGRDDFPSIRTVLDVGEPRNAYFRV